MDMKRKRDYERPRMAVVELQHRMQLLQMSGKRQSYGTAIEDDWE